MYNSTSYFHLTLIKQEKLSHLFTSARSPWERRRENPIFISFKYISIIHKLYIHHKSFLEESLGIYCSKSFKNLLTSSKHEINFYTFHLVYYVFIIFSYAFLKFKLHLNSFHHLYHLYTCLWDFILFLFLFWNYIHYWEIGGRV